MRAFLALLVLLAAPAAAQTVATSAGPNRVGVTVYRDPDRPADRRPNLQWLGGYALITETRAVSLPAGEVDLRFEGVAGGIVPASAIVAGLPDGVLERNRDARLLSPGALVDAHLGRRVTVRRTSPATGAVREVEAVVRSGADQALVIETAEGAEALRCSGLPEGLLFERVPADLSAKPTLAVRTRASRAWKGEVTLSYLASGFDWTASYVATLGPSGDRMDLFAWVTFANGDETSFRAADAQAVAGKVNREATPRDVGEAKGLNLRCWPLGTTSDVSELETFAADGAEEIVVTGSRIAPPALALPAPPPPAAPALEAVQEELGDLKLYRIPEPVTVAAKSQKQVAMLVRPNVPVDAFYRARIGGVAGSVDLPLTRAFRARNTAEGGLGLPLPDGRLALFARGPDREILLGQGRIADRAVGEEVEFEAGRSTAVRATLASLGDGRTPGRAHRLTVTNDLARPIVFEAAFGSPPVAADRPVTERNGARVMRFTVPANASVTVGMRLPD